MEALSLNSIMVRRLLKKLKMLLFHGFILSIFLLLYNNNLLRLLDEADFWKLQESEHTVLIEQVAPNLEQNYVAKLREFRQLFNQTRGKVTQLTETVIRSKSMITQDLS